MKKNDHSKTIPALSFPLSILIIIVSCVGLFTPGFYSAETSNWQAQSVGQDISDLCLIVPCLIVTAIVAYRNSETAKTIWGGVVLYLTYTFTIYCFNIHFNKLFVLYCLCLGLSFYSLMYFLFTNLTVNTKKYLVNKSVIHFVGIYFIIISVLFYFLWLSEIVPAVIQNTLPGSIVETGLFTNGVHVIDLAVFLPGTFIIGIFLLKRMSLAIILTPVILTFFILMDITIGTLGVVMKMKRVESNLVVSAIMSLLALFSLILLIWYLKALKPNVTSGNFISS